jgi:protein associated with RNAse G/E
MHKNNLIILDMLMEIVDMEKFALSAQFHVYNTSRFNEDRRKIKYNEDRISLIAKNNKSLVEIIKSILTNCGFDSLKSFVFEILSNDEV